MRRGRRQKQQIAVAALKTYLLLHAHAAPLELRAAVRRRCITQAIGERQRMPAAADRFAMRVEQDHFELAQSVAFQQLRDPQTQPLDSKGGRHLPDESPRIRKSELHRHPPLPFQVRAIVRALQRLLDHALAALEGLLGLEQRRNLDSILHPEHAAHSRAPPAA